MRIPTSDQLIVYILETTIAIHLLTAADLPAASSSLEYKLKGDVTLFVSMYGMTEIAPFWSAIAEVCQILYDLKQQPPDVEQLHPASKLDGLRVKLRREARS